MDVSINSGFLISKENNQNHNMLVLNFSGVTEISHNLRLRGILTSVERAASEVQRLSSWFASAFLSSAEGPEVFGSLGGDICKQLQNYPASFGQKRNKVCH